MVIEVYVLIHMQFTCNSIPIIQGTFFDSKQNPLKTIVINFKIKRAITLKFI